MPAARPATAETNSIRGCPGVRAGAVGQRSRPTICSGRPRMRRRTGKEGRTCPREERHGGPGSAGRRKHSLPPRWGQGGSRLISRTRLTGRFPMGKRARWRRELVGAELVPSRRRRPRGSRRAQRWIVLCHRGESQAGCMVRPGRWSACYRHPLALRRPTTKSERRHDSRILAER